MSPASSHLDRRRFLQRTGAIGLAAGAAPLALSSCSKSDKGLPESVGDADYKPGSGSLKHQLGEEIGGINYPEDYKGPKARKLEPFGDGETEFTVLGRTIPELDYSTNYYAQHVEEVTGVKVAYTPVPLGEDGQTKVNAILSAGDLPHAIMTGMGLFSLSQVAAYGQQGLFLPLDKLIDENAPHIRDMFDTFPDMRSLYTAPDGRLYAVPSMNDCYHCKSSGVRTWYNSRWLEGVGAAVPETLADFEALMDAFRGFAGKPGSSVLTVTHADAMMPLLNFFLGSFVNTSGTNMLLEDGKVTWVPTQDGYRQGIIWLQGQFAKGNLDRAIFSATDEQLKQMGDNADGPRFGIVYGNSQGEFCSTADPSDPNSTAAIMKPLPPMAGPDGVRTCDWEWYQIGSPNFVITNSCPDPVAMIRWADYQFELGMTIAMGRGEQGKGWDYSGAGSQGIDGKQAVYEVIPDADTANQVWWEWGPFYKSSAQRLGEAVLPDSPSIEPSLYAAGKAYEPYRVEKERKLPELVFDTDQAAQIGELETNLTQSLEEGIASFCTGKSDASRDADWEAFVAKFDSIGVKQYLELHQTAYDEQF